MHQQNHFWAGMASIRGMSAGKAKLILEHLPEEEWSVVYERARRLTENRFQKSLRFFVPLYFSDFCVNNCIYCGFQSGNRSLERKVLTTDEFVQEARLLWRQGHRTLLLIAGEHPVHSGVDRMASYLEALAREGLHFSIMAEVGPLAVEEYRRLHELGVNHCILFQETYDRTVYANVHHGLKKNYDWRLYAMERALEAGIENVGLGILLGLGPWQQDVLALIGHAHRIKEVFGRFPATLSFPRLRPSSGNSLKAYEPISDEDFLKILAVSRLACPDSGFVLSTRETPALRRRILEMGIAITHLSAGSSTVPQGYTLQKTAGQFELADCRSLEEVVCETEGLSFSTFLNL